jgi:predicted DNA-binding antitoxin AbrB/MazE fold protein
VELHQNKSRSFFCAQQKYSFLVKLLSLERRFIETSNLLEKGLIQNKFLWQSETSPKLITLFFTKQKSGVERRTNNRIYWRVRANFRILEKIIIYVVNIHTMTKEMAVIYEHGVFKPLKTVDCSKSAKMWIRIDKRSQRCERRVYRKRGV